MGTHVALLRGINVGGHARLPMAQLRDIATALGLEGVETYIQSGNLVFTSAHRGAESLADSLERAIAAASGVHPGVVVLTRGDLARVVERNPYPHQEDPRLLHVTFHRAELGPKALAAVAEAQRRARAKGSRDEVTAIGSTLYLHVPDGLGRSGLAVELARAAVTATTGPVATTRNWATVTTVLTMLGS